MTIKDKIDKLEKVVYKNSNVDEMKRVSIYSKSMWISSKDTEKAFNFIITKVIGLSLDEVQIGIEYKVGKNNFTFLMESYEKNKKIVMAYVIDNTIYRQTYKFSSFGSKTRFKNITLLKKEKRIYGVEQWIGKFYWRKNVRKKAKLLKKEIKKILKNNN